MTKMSHIYCNSFPCVYFISAYGLEFWFNGSHKEIGIGRGHFGAHGAAVLEITVGHRTFSDHFSRLSEQTQYWTDIMSERQ